MDERKENNSDEWRNKLNVTDKQQWSNVALLYSTYISTCVGTLMQKNDSETSQIKSQEQYSKKKLFFKNDRSEKWLTF